MKVKRMGITEILRRIWLFANKIKSSESVGKPPTHLIVKLNSSLRQKLGTHTLGAFTLFAKEREKQIMRSARDKLIVLKKVSEIQLVVHLNSCN